MVVSAGTASARLGVPQATVERGTVDLQHSSYIRRWSWKCGCVGEIIAGTLIDLRCCSAHE